jgi:hypothetical protein
MLARSARSLLAASSRRAAGRRQRRAAHPQALLSVYYHHTMQPTGVTQRTPLLRNTIANTTACATPCATRDAVHGPLCRSGAHASGMARQSAAAQLTGTA